MTDSHQTQPIALQLYSIRELCADDMIKALRSVAEIGYPGVEFAGWHGVPVKDLRGALDQFGLTAVGAHIAYARFDTEIEVVLDELKTLDCTHAILPWLAPEQRPTTIEQASALAVTLNAWGAWLKDRGVRLGYHNHDFEFKPVGVRTVFDLLVEETVPSLVDFELDLGWIHFAGFDPEAIMSRLSGRIPLVHVKDVAAGPTFEAAPVGDGVLDWPSLLATAKASGAEWFIVEQDNSADPLADAARSYESLRQLLAS